MSAEERLQPVPTRPERTAGLSDSRRHRIERRIGLAVLVVGLILGAANLFGVRSDSVTASGGGFELTVTYASISRPGLTTPWTVVVRRPDGFDGPVTIASRAEYFELFDENGFSPEPAASTTSGGLVVWEFEPPDGEVLTVSFDGRLEPASHRPRTGETSVLVDGDPVVSVSYTTVAMP